MFRCIYIICREPFLIYAKVTPIKLMELNKLTLLILLILSIFSVKKVSSPLKMM